MKSLAVLSLVLFVPLAFADQVGSGLTQSPGAAGGRGTPLPPPGANGNVLTVEGGAWVSDFVQSQYVFIIPPFTGGVSVPITQLFGDGCDGVDAALYGANPAAADNLVPLTNALAAAYTSKTGVVCLGGGTYVISNTLDIPNKVQLRGRGRGDTITSSGFASNTAIQASSTAFPANAPVITIGPLPATAPRFGTRISNMTVDCNGVAGALGIQDNDGEEQSGGDHLMVLRCQGASLQVNGSDKYPGGSQNEYGWHDMEIMPSNAALPTTVPVQLLNVEEGGGLSRISIVNDAGFPVNYGAVVSGNNFTVDSIHIEAAGTNGGAGMLLGGNSPFATVGAQNIRAINVVCSTACLGPTIEIGVTPTESPSGIDIFGPEGTIKNDQTGGTVFSQEYHLGGQFGGTSVQLDLGWGNPWQLNNRITNTQEYLSFNDTTTPNMEFKYGGGSFPGFQFFVDGSGNLQMGMNSHGASDIIFDDGYSKFCLAYAAVCNGLNLQGALSDANNSGYTGIFSNLFYSNADGLYHVPGNGSGAIGGIVHQSGFDIVGGAGMGIIAGGGLTEPSTLTSTALQTNYMPLLFPNTGGVQFLSGSQPGCAAQQRGTWFFKKDGTNTNDIFQYCGYAGSTLGWITPAGGGSGNATTINSAAIPSSQACLGSNASSQLIAGTCTGSSNAFQANGTALTSSSTINFQNSAAFNGLTLNFTNPSAGIVKLGASGILGIPGGGTGTATPGLVAGTNVTLSGSWPNQTINTTAGSGGPPTGTAAGALAGSYPAPTLRDSVSATDYASVQAACTAVGSNGEVVIPWNYPGTDKTWACGNTRVINLMPYARTIINAKEWGARGDGNTFTDMVETIGSANVTSAGYCFVANDVGKHYKAFNSNTGTGPTGKDLYGNIVSVASCVATLDKPMLAVGTKMFTGTDDTAAVTAMLFQAAQGTPNGISQIYFPGGIYCVRGPLYSASSVMIRGDGRNASAIRDIDPTADMLVIRPPNSAQNKGTGPNAFPSQGGIRDLNLQGEGTGTTGSLLVAATASYTMENLIVGGHAGIGIYSLGERQHIRDIFWRNVRRPYVTSPNVANNETYITDFEAMDSGCVLDSQAGDGTYYSYNINAVNGVFPASGNIVSDQHTAFTIDGAQNFHIAHGSIKSERCMGGVQITEANAEDEMSHVYFENGTNQPAISPDFVGVGPHQKTTLVNPITTTQALFDVVDGSWFNNVMGKQTDLPLTVEGGGSPANFTDFWIFPPDYLYNSPAASSIGGGITRGMFERVGSNGFVRDQVGSGWHFVGGRGHQGTTAQAWPAGAILEQGYINGSNYMHFTDVHFNGSGGSLSSAYTVLCNPNIEQACGSIVDGWEPDIFFVPGTPNGNTFGMRLMFTGNNGTGHSTNNPVAGNIEIFGSSLVDFQGQSLGNQYAFYRQYGGTADTQKIDITAMFGGYITRPTLANGSIPILDYVDGLGNTRYQNLVATGTTNSTNWLNSYVMQQFAPKYGFGDTMNASNFPNHMWTWQDDLHTPGLQYQSWNPTGATPGYATVFQITDATEAQMTAGSSPFATMLVTGTAATFGTRSDGSPQLVQTGTKTACTVANRGALWFVPGATGVADLFQYCGKSAANAYAWQTSGSGGGGGGTGTVNGVKINGGVVVGPDGSGNIDLQIPNLQNGLGTSVSTSGTGDAQVTQVNLTQTVDYQVIASYTVPAIDCGGTVIFNNASAVNATFPQAGVAGNFALGCVVDVLNIGAGTITLHFSSSNWNGVTATPTIAGSGTHHAHVISNGTSGGVGQYYGWNE